MRFGVVAAFALPAVAVWAVAAIFVSSLLTATSTVVLGLAIAATYGVVEVAALPLPVATFPFGTPSNWIRARRSLGGQLFVWGVTLGPGILTRNPYASIWLALIGLGASKSSVAAAAIGSVGGAAHGVARATGILRNVHRRITPLEVMSERLTWKFVDGLLLLVAAGLLVGVLIES